MSETTTQAPPTQAVAVTPTAGQVARRGFAGDELSVSAETAGTALAAQARAMVEARFVMALRKPRDWDDVRSKLLRACERPGFAGHATEKVWGAAWYRKPVGDGVEGFSIRFAEEALRCMTNVDVQTVTVYEDDGRRIVNVVVTDLESNISFPTSISITKTVERRFLKKGETAIRVRTNSRGEPTYIVEATEDEVFTKQQNQVSKAIRTGTLRLLPGDIQSECRTRILAIRQGDIAKDPDGARKKVADGFAGLNILPSQIKEYLGHELAQATPAEIASLRDIYAALKEGTLTWAQVMEANEAEDVPGEGTHVPAEGTPKKPPIVELTERLKAQQAPPVAAATAVAQAGQHPADDPNAEKEPAAPAAKGAGPFAKAVEKQRSLVE